MAQSCVRDTRPTRNSDLIVEVEKAGKTSFFEEVYLLPLCLNWCKLLLQTSERGGNDRGAGAIVVCAPNGQALKPFVAYKAPKPNGDQALYSVNEGHSVVEVAYREGTIWIDEYWIERSGNAVWIIKHSLFCGYEVEIIKRLSRFRPAIEAVKAKWECQSCTHVHFPFEPRPSIQDMVEQVLSTINLG